MLLISFVFWFVLLNNFYCEYENTEIHVIPGFQAWFNLCYRIHLKTKRSPAFHKLSHMIHD